MHHGPVLLIFWVILFIYLFLRLYCCVFTQILSSPDCRCNEKQLAYLLTVAGADSYFWNEMGEKKKKKPSRGELLCCLRS